MLCTVTEQVLVAIYLEQQKEVPHMRRLTHGLLDLSPEKFTAAIERLRHDRLIKNVEVIEDDAGTPLFAFIEQTRLTMAGQEYIENKFSLGDWWAQTKKIQQIQQVLLEAGLHSLAKLASDVQQLLLVDE
ncbi:MAG: YjcQ family protein [Selenomonadaceae bacterium]